MMKAMDAQADTLVLRLTQCAARSDLARSGRYALDVWASD
jgi:hypothetical protein